MEKVGKKIQSLRKNKGITQEEFAEILSVSAQAVSKWENNLSSPDIDLLPVIARYFGITMDELFGYRLDSINYKEKFIKFMADNGVLKFGSFQLSSGRISPYYIDTGNYKSGAQLTRLGEFYAECLCDHHIHTDVLFGAENKGIPLSVATSMVLYSRYGIDADYCFFQKNSESETQPNRFIGKQLLGGENVTVIGDTMTSGKRLRESIQSLKEAADVKISNVIIAVDRQEKGIETEKTALEELQQECGVKVYSVVNIEDIIHAVEHGIIIGTEHLEALKNYRRQYGVEHVN